MHYKIYDITYDIKIIIATTVEQICFLVSQRLLNCFIPREKCSLSSDSAYLWPVKVERET